MARKNPSPKDPIPVESTRHKDKRKNIPTEELRGFVREDEQRPKDVKFPGLLYARDPSLDPQLVWKGKDEQDREELTVPAVPVYIQEKIHPRALIEDVRQAAREGQPRQAELFADFNGLPADFDQRVDFYNHEGNWANRFILGDSLLVMTSLAEKEGLKGKVQMIYIDPPYGIKFGSNWQVSTRKRDVKDGRTEDATRQPEQIRAFRDTWELGIHSYLAYWRDRLTLSRELLTDTGSMFVQIGDQNVHLVRCVLDEVFGSGNFIGLISVQKTTSATNVYLPLVSDYLLWYGKNTDQTKYRPLYQAKQVGREGAFHYSMVEVSDGVRRGATSAERSEASALPDDARLFTPGDLQSASMGRDKGEGAACWFPVQYEGKTYLPNEKNRWKTNEDGIRRLISARRVIGQDQVLRYVRYINDFAALGLNNLWTDVGGASDKRYVVETTPKVVERCLLMTTDPGDLVLDPTCGSGTTAYVAEHWGRRWITIDTSRVALALARTRLMTAKFPYYLLADSPEGAQKEAELAGTAAPAHPTGGDIKRGFVYKRVPHVKLKSIANNEEIDAIHAQCQEKLESLRAKINKAFKQGWEAWQVPRVAQPPSAVSVTEGEAAQPGAAVPHDHPHAKLLLEWWKLQRERQAEIDASIARRADTELLYDQPYEDSKRIRVAGPFTVESLSPHRTISVTEKKELAVVGREGWTMKMVGAGQFGNIIIENLKKAGVQNTIKNERLKFDRLEIHPGLWVHATGEYTEKDGKSRRIAVCIGPEHGTVGPELVKEAAKEAVQGLGYDLLIVCGFAFDPHVSEEAKRYGKLTVLPTRIHADLQMGDEFLKKTGAANLFMVFGEPDLNVAKNEDGKIIVVIKGLDIYDPTTGQVRSNSTDDIACWFIDTDYNGESFFVRHAYFTGADRPYEKLQRALRAEIDEAAWSALYSTVSRPFDPPKTGKIAIKVINHYGDEVLKVHSVP